MHAYAAGVLFDQDMAYEASQGAVDFMAAREHGILAASPYDLSLSKNFERLESFALGFARAFPMGQASAAIGGAFKLHQGSRFERTSISGVFTQGAANNVGYTRWTADSGSGFSWDFGASLKPTSGVQLGLVLENINSSFKWKTQRQNLTLDSSTAVETSAPPVLETLEANRPKATRFAITLVSPAKDSSLTTEMRRFRGKSLWRFGFERVWAPQHLVFRIGSFRDETSNLRVWTGGVGYLGKRVELNLGVQADRWPVVQDSSAFGGAFSVAVLL
jgi:hypothetical protein